MRLPDPAVTAKRLLDEYHQFRVTAPDPSRPWQEHLEFTKRVKNLLDRICAFEKGETPFPKSPLEACEEVES